MNYDEKYADSLGVEHHREVIKRLQRAIAKADLDAVVIFRPDFFHWINTHQSVFIDGGMLGMAMLIVPQEGAPVGICSEHEYDAMLERAAVRDWRAVQFWTGQEDRYATQKTPAIRYASDQRSTSPEGGILPFVVSLKNTLEQEGLSGARLGVELNNLNLGLHELLVAELAGYELKDSLPLLTEARMLKTDYEVYNMRYAAHQQWTVCHDIMMNLRPGDTYADLRHRIQVGAAQAHSVDGNRFLMIYMGDTPAATSRNFDRTLAMGDMLSIDLGFTVRGYVSDSGRAYVMGEPSELQQQIADAYGEAHQVVKKAMVPGARTGDIYDMAASMVREKGLTDFRRGHIGHGLGCCTFVEEFPFLMTGADTLLQPNMIMTLEIPFYGRGFGGYFEEDILLITEDGNESLTPAPFGLNVISGS
jgi:Xaa-Pro dipeptidase